MDKTLPVCYHHQLMLNYSLTAQTTSRKKNSEVSKSNVLLITDGRYRYNEALNPFP